jgi:large exoprotein involved in heme utilization and adhesion
MVRHGVKTCFIACANSIGNGGDLTVVAKNLFVFNGAQLNVSSFGKGDAGSLRVTVQETALFEGTDLDGTPSAAVSSLEPRALGNGRAIQISARQLVVKDGATLSSESRALGRAADPRARPQSRTHRTARQPGRNESNVGG